MMSVGSASIVAPAAPLLTPFAGEPFSRRIRHRHLLLTGARHAKNGFTHPQFLSSIEDHGTSSTMAAICELNAHWARSCLSIARPRIKAISSVHSHSRLLKPASFRQLQKTASSYNTDEDAEIAPKKQRGGSKVFKTADEAVADIKSGSTILSAGFGLCGVAGWSNGAVLR
jgi:hypothetical protein